MPYIKREQRLHLDVQEAFPQDCGQLNYTITRYIQRYIDTKGECYQTYNDIIGALEGAKLELYRRQIGRYEDIKIHENGDVYDK